MRLPQIKAKIGDIETKIRKLREALEPQAAMISDIPPFDLKLAYELYGLLLKPVESGWKSAKEPDRRHQRCARSVAAVAVADGAGRNKGTTMIPCFRAIGSVPWLARTHAVTTVPSAAALRTLRQLPPGKPNREELVAFGDPIFNTEQEAEAEVCETKSPRR